MLLIRRFILGAEAEGVFTLFAIAFFFMGVILFGIGLVGEYVGRILQQVRARPRYVVQTILQHEAGKDDRLQADAANVRRCMPGVAIVNRRQRQQPPNLVRVTTQTPRLAKSNPLEIVLKPNL